MGKTRLKRSEAQEQIAVVDYCDIKNIPIYAIPNGGKRNPIEAAHLKAQGVKAGVPDLCIPMARRGFHGLYIEMKVGRNKPTKKQIEWGLRLRAEDYDVRVCYSADEAIRVIKEYTKEG